MKKTVLTWLAALLAVLAVPAALLAWGFLLPAQYGIGRASCRERV